MNELEAIQYVNREVRKGINSMSGTSFLGINFIKAVHEAGHTVYVASVVIPLTTAIVSVQLSTNTNVRQL